MYCDLCMRYARGFCRRGLFAKTGCFRCGVRYVCMRKNGDIVCVCFRCGVRYVCMCIYVDVFMIDEMVCVCGLCN